MRRLDLIVIVMLATSAPAAAAQAGGLSGRVAPPLDTYTAFEDDGPVWGGGLGRVLRWGRFASPLVVLDAGAERDAYADGYDDGYDDARRERREPGVRYRVVEAPGTGVTVHYGATPDARRP